MVRRWAKKLILKVLDGPEDWALTLEDTLLSMGCDLVGVDPYHKLRMMRAAPLKAADLKLACDYWREEALKNAHEANKADKRARAWKAAAKAARNDYRALDKVFTDAIGMDGG